MKLGRTSVAAAVALAVASLVGTARAADDNKPLRALFVCGGCCHDYEHQKDIITQGISARANVVWTIAYDPDKGTKHTNPVYANKDWAKNFDVIVHDECTADVKDLETINTVLQPHKDGLPAVVLHCGMHSYRSEGFPKATPWFDFTGLVSTGHGPQQPIAITLVDKENPILKGLSDWTTINEELYNNAAGQLQATAKALAKGKQTYKQYPKKDGKEDKTAEPKEVSNETIVAWTNTYNGKTKVFATTIGHNNATCADARYLDMVTRGLLWSVDKLDDAHFHPAPAGATGQPAAAK